MYNPPASSDYSLDESNILDYVQAYYVKFNFVKF